MLTLGLSAFYHDSAAALVDGADIVAAAQQERFSRIKHDPALPVDAIAWCLDHAGVRPDDLDAVAFYDKPIRKLHRLLATHLAVAPRGRAGFERAMRVWMGDKIHHRAHLDDALRALGATRPLGDRLLFTEHHESHAASAYLPSPFDDAAVLTLDGVGEWATTSLAHGRGPDLQILRELRFPHSLGLLYAAFTAHLGFRVNSGEYKVMGLAPYGEPRFADQILDEVIDLRPDGSFRLDMGFFAYLDRPAMTTEHFARRFGPPRDPESELTQHDLDLAASVQQVTEEVVLGLVDEAHRATGSRNLCLAGGVALNCVANGRIQREGPFEHLWVQPAAGDAGGAVGAALLANHRLGRVPRPDPGGVDAMRGGYLGPRFSDDDVERTLRGAGAVFASLDEEALLDQTVDALAAGRAVGWFQGPMEFGPRALGGRSILADPRSSEMQRTLNLRVKFRESFRPFAPAVLAEEAHRWFDLDVDSPYMLLVTEVAAAHCLPVSPEDAARRGLDQRTVRRSDIPAVTHVDRTARVQTVHAETNPRFHALLVRWYERTGCPVLVNTSFNVRGEPIVGTPEDALACFLGTDIETLVVERCLLHEEDQTLERRTDHRFGFAPD